MDERLLGSNPKNNSNLSRRIWVETKKISKIAFPSMVARVTQFGIFVVTQAFIGHLGELDLAAYALIQIITVRFVNGILLGMSSATETLCGQAFGAKQYHMMGIYLQRSWIINIVTATILLPVFIFGAPIFKLLGEEDDVAEIAGYISLWFIPILYYFPFAFSIQKYLQTQLKNPIVGWLSAFSFVLHVLLSWIFVSKLSLGIPGAMGAMIISYWLVLIGMFWYVFGGWCPNTWSSFSIAAFSDLLPVVKLSLSSGVMLCLELWYNAVLVLLAGYLKNATVEISAFSICLNIIAWDFMVFIGFLTGASVRISNELGKGDAEAAKFSVKVISSISVCLGVVLSILCFVFGHKIGYLFTSDEEVIEAVSDLSLLLSLSVLLNSVQPVLSGVAVGAGRQSVVAYINVGCYFLIGVPVGCLLGYVADLGITGLWIGMIIGVVMQSLVLGYVTFKTDWNEQVKKASDRLNKWLLNPSNESNENSAEERLIMDEH
ncbi:protein DETOXIFICATION 24-like [Corylus avellana]|uniref:protein DETOXIFICATION 24-like n=1 Tax=Corylus avellana TaxID=13451 RepID=UPI00286A2894|nr:protein DETOXIFICATION 24-like [Corylus avellana]